MLHKYEAALFDMDGTLIDSKPAIELAWKTVAIKNGVNITSDDFEKHIHGRSGIILYLIYLVISLNLNKKNKRRC
ncbi:hypothetical protein CRG86_007595 [Photobacterium leiognathi]|nr:hypothetical protein CRG86_007595 [Photobacterium leiognathi]